MIAIRRHSTIVLGRIGERSGRIPTKELVYLIVSFGYHFVTFSLTKGEIICVRAVVLLAIGHAHIIFSPDSSKICCMESYDDATEIL